MTDEELIEEAREFREGILGGLDSAGMCYAVCWPLAAYLRVAHGINCEQVEVDWGDGNHVYLELPDGRVLDPTYDQFDENGPAVYLGEPLMIHTLGLTGG